jgi:hypothetical protein
MASAVARWGGVQKLRSFPLLSDPSALAALAAALRLPSPA